MLVKTIWTLSSYKVSLKLSITKKRIAWSLPKTNHNVSQLMISFKRFLSLLIHIYFGVKRLKYRSFWRKHKLLRKIKILLPPSPLRIFIFPPKQLLHDWLLVNKILRRTSGNIGSNMDSTGACFLFDVATTFVLRLHKSVKILPLSNDFMVQWLSGKSNPKKQFVLNNKKITNRME